MLKMRFTTGYTPITVFVNGRINDIYSDIPLKDGVYQFAHSSSRVKISGFKLVFISYQTVIGERDITTKEATFAKEFYSNTTAQHRAKFENWLKYNGFKTARV